jgi:hypothetical protein
LPPPLLAPPSPGGVPHHTPSHASHTVKPCNPAARSASDKRDGTVLTRHPPTLRCTLVVSIHKVTVCPAQAELSQNCCPPTHRFPLGGTTRSTSTASGQLAGFAAVAALSDAGGGGSYI